MTDLPACCQEFEASGVACFDCEALIEQDGSAEDRWLYRMMRRIKEIELQAHRNADRIIR